MSYEILLDASLVRRCKNDNPGNIEFKRQIMSLGFGGKLHKIKTKQDTII